MNQVAPIEPAVSGVETVYRPSLFRTDAVHRTIQAGATVADIVVQHVDDPLVRDLVRVRLESADGAVPDAVIPRTAWHRVRPKTGTRVMITTVPQGGSRGMFRMVLALAITIAATVVFGPGGPAFGTGFWATVGSAVAIGATPMAGTLAMRALLPDAPCPAGLPG